MYSALISRSLMVALMPRLSITGSFERPTSLRSEKFCMLRAPTWRQSAYFSMTSRSLVSMISVMTGRPVASRASASSLQPFGAQPLEGVRRGARLEGAAAQNLRAGVLARPARCRGDLLAVLDRARPAHHHDLVARRFRRPPILTVPVIAAAEFARRRACTASAPA